MNTPVTITATVVQDENGDMALLFTADVLSRLGWAEGDVVEWQDTPHGVLVSKSTTTMQPLTETGEE